MAKYTNTSVERGFRILELLAARRQAVDVSTVASEAGLPVSTAYRFLAVLADLGYVQKTENELYWLGYRLFKLSGYANEITLVKRAAQQILSLLANDVGLTVHMGALEGLQVIYHAKFESENSMRIVSAVGMRLDAHVSALGKVLLSHLSDAEVDRLYRMNPLRKHTQKSITTLASLKHELRDVRARKVAYDNEEIVPGLRCVAVPVYDHEHELVCAISISGSTMHMTNDAIPCLERKLQQAAGEVADALAGSRGLKHPVGDPARTTGR